MTGFHSEIRVIGPPAGELRLRRNHLIAALRAATKRPALPDVLLPRPSRIVRRRSGIKFRFRKEPEFEYRGLLKPPIRNAIITAGKRKPACGPYPDARSEQRPQPLRTGCRPYRGQHSHPGGSWCRAGEPGCCLPVRSDRLHALHPVAWTRNHDRSWSNQRPFYERKTVS